MSYNARWLLVKNRTKNSARWLLNCEEATPLVKEFNNIINCKKKEILFNWFKEMLNDIEISRSKIYVKAKLVKMLEKYPKLKKSSLSLNFMKN